jgi:hypothetical protein
VGGIYEVQCSVEMVSGVNKYCFRNSEVNKEEGGFKETETAYRSHKCILIFQIKESRLKNRKEMASPVY